MLERPAPLVKLRIPPNQKVVAEYKQLLQDLAREKGFELTEAELMEAAVALKDAAAGEISDAP